MEEQKLLVAPSSEAPREVAPTELLADPLWRLSNLYWIEDEDGHVVKFKPNFFQAFLLKNLHPRNIILKARQLGMSTFIAILFLDQILFKKNKKAAIVADKLDSGKNIFRKIEFAWENLDARLKTHLNLVCVTDQGSFYEFSNGSSIRVGTTIHSGTYQFLHVSELGPLCKESPEKAEAVIKSAFPTVHDSPDSLVFIESTAEGENNEFHIRCVDAQRRLEQAESQTPDDPGESLLPYEYRFFFFPWWQNPKYEYSEEMADKVVVRRELNVYFDELEERLEIKLPQTKRAWYEMKKRDIKERMQEQYPSYPEEAFLSSGDKMFSQDILREKLKNEPVEPCQLIGDLAMYKPYKRGHRYGGGGDVGSGMSQDHSTCVIIDFTTNEVVATYRSNTTDPITFAYEMAKIGNMYGGCILAPEANFMGSVTALTLQGMYPHVYRYEIKGYTETKETMRVGWLTNGSTKPRMFYELKEAFESEVDPLIVLDKTILHEAMAYSKTDISLSEKDQQKMTRHFDLLTACAIANQMRSQAEVFASEDSPALVRHIETRRQRNRVYG